MTETLRTDPVRLPGFIKNSPILSRIISAAGDERIYLAGGAVRDVLLGHEPQDLDLVVETNPAELGLEVDRRAVIHERFQTAEAVVTGTRVHIARARTERYPAPGALPVVSPAALGEDLARRDFTINAMAVALDRPEKVIDPLGGRDDLERGVLRILHEGSFRDDPTRALRAARYAARFGYDLAPGTADLLAGTDLGTVSRDRVEAELELIAEEPAAVEALRLASVWGLIELPEGSLDLASEALSIRREPAWAGLADRGEVILAAIRFDRERMLGELDGEPQTPSAGVTLARGLSGTDLLLARAAGVGWLDRYMAEWRDVELEITGADLLAAGVPQGPAIGAGIEAALEAKLDHGVSGADEELKIALEAAGGGGGPDRPAS